VELVFYVDSDDGALADYSNFFSEAHDRYPSLMRIWGVSGEPKSVSLSWNDIAGESTGDVLIMANDDQVYGHPGWDVRLDEEIRKFPDEIYCIWFNDGINGDRHCAFPIVSRRWYQTVGYFTPGVFEFLFNDTWIMAVAQLLGRVHYVEDVTIEHLHHSVGKSPLDTTYRRQLSCYHRDADLFIRTEPIRRRDAALLLRVIKEASVQCQSGREERV
jgi:glycosyl transferase/beta-hydroxylase protein BlmF